MSSRRPRPPSGRASRWSAPRRRRRTRPAPRPCSCSATARPASRAIPTRSLGSWSRARSTSLRPGRTRSRAPAASGSTSTRRRGSRRRPSAGQPVGDTARFDIAVDDAGTIEASGVSIDGVAAAEVPGALHLRLDTRALAAGPAHRAVLGARHGRQPLRAVGRVRARRHAAHRRALARAATRSTSRSPTPSRARGSLNVQIDDVTGALHVQRTLPLTFAEGTATARIAGPGAGSRPACGCACRPSTRSGIRPPSRRRGWRPGRGDPAPPRRPRPPPGALAAAARGRARRQLRQRPRGDPLAGGGRRARDRRGSPAVGARLPLAPRAPRALARSEGRGGLRLLPGRARRARVLRAGRRPADARRAARGRGAQRRAPGRLPVARAAAGTCSSRCSSKRHQYAVAEAAGIGVPLTFAADSEDEARRGRGGAQLPGGRQAGRSDPVQAALRPARARVPDAGGAARGLAQRGRLRAAAAGGDPGRRRDALDGRLVHGRLGHARSGCSAAASSCRCRAASAPAAWARRAGATTSSSRRSRC